MTTFWFADAKQAQGFLSFFKTLPNVSIIVYCYSLFLFNFLFFVKTHVFIWIVTWFCRTIGLFDFSIVGSVYVFYFVYIFMCACSFVLIVVNFKAYGENRGNPFWERMFITWFTSVDWFILLYGDTKLYTMFIVWLNTEKYQIVSWIFLIKCGWGSLVRTRVSQV